MGTPEKRVAARLYSRARPASPTRSARQHACACAGRAQVGFASVRAQRVHGEAVLGATLFYAFAREMDCVDYNFPDLPGFERTALPEWEARVREPSTRMRAEPLLSLRLCYDCVLGRCPTSLLR